MVGESCYVTFPVEIGHEHKLVCVVHTVHTLLYDFPADFGFKARLLMPGDTAGESFSDRLFLPTRSTFKLETASNLGVSRLAPLVRDGERRGRRKLGAA